MVANSYREFYVIYITSIILFSIYVIALHPLMPSKNCFVLVYYYNICAWHFAALYMQL